MKIIIGKIDKADFPELGLLNINVKIDTGAYTSTIHSHDIREVTIKGEKRLKFKLLDPSHPQYNHKAYKIKQYKKRRIKNSFGQSEERFVFETIIELFGNKYPIELTLSERGEMKYPILLGRKLLNGRFLVDTSRRNLSYVLKSRPLKKSSDK